MDASWTSPWWQYLIMAAIFSMLPGLFWLAGTMSLAAMVSDHWVKCTQRGIKDDTVPMSATSPSPGVGGVHIYRSIQDYIIGPRSLGGQRWRIWISRGNAILLSTALVLWFEIDIWVGVSNDCVTSKQAWLLQAYFFLPFFLFCFTSVYLSRRWYLHTVARMIAEHSKSLKPTKAESLPSPGQYLSTVIDKLKRDGFELRENVMFESSVFRYVAKRRKFELRLGGVVVNYFIFNEYQSVTIAAVRSFAAACAGYSLKDRKLFPPQGAVFCYAVAMASNVDPDTANIVREENPPRPGSIYQIPVIYDTTNGELYYFEKRPTWTGALWDRIRETIRRVLAPER